MSSLTQNPHAKNYFRVQTRRLAASFEPFTRSEALAGPEKFSRKSTCDPVIFVREFPISTGRESVKSSFRPRSNLSLRPLCSSVATGGLLGAYPPQTKLQVTPN